MTKLAKRQAFQVRNEWPTGFEAVLKLRPTEAINGWTFVMWSDDQSGIGFITVNWVYIHSAWIIASRNH